MVLHGLPRVSMQAQSPAAQSPTAPVLSVSGAVATPLSLSPSDLRDLPRATVRTTANGMTTAYEGVWVADVLRKAGVSLGAALRGSSLASYVIATASDGYRVVFSLGELDPELSATQVLLADTENGRPLFGENGSFRLVVPSDKRGARSVRLLTSLQVVAVPKP